MAKKRIHCNFFNIQEPDGAKGKIDVLFQQQKVIIDSKKVHNVEVSGFILRITYLKRKVTNGQHWWVGIVEKLDTTEMGEISNIAGVKSTYGQNEDEGPIVNTGFVYYPLTNTFVLHKKQGGVNDYRLGVFIRKLLKENGIAGSKSSKFVLDVLPDLTKLDRLNKANRIKTLEYSFALPENLSKLKSKDRAIFGDLLLANRLGGKRMKVLIRADEMHVSETLTKVKEILKLGTDAVSSLRATAEHGDIEEPLDLLTNKFSDFIDVELKKGKKETVDLIIETVSEIFENQRTLITNMYVNEEVEE